MTRPVAFLVLIAVAPGAAWAQAVTPAVRAWRQQHEAEIVRELTTLVAIPNLASDAANIRRNADALRSML